MLTDGALRMLVLLHFHNLGYSPIELAFLFVFYELASIFTNLYAGFLGNKKGLKIPLVAGLFLQTIALVTLSFMNLSWMNWQLILYAMLAQCLSGIAKDLTKMSSKTAIKFLVPSNQESTLFKWVSILTGSKNAIKGIGFFVGGAFLQFFGFQLALWILAGILLIPLLSSLFLPKKMGTMKKKMRLIEIFNQKKDIQILSFARFFLFSSRDIWFVVGVPLFLSAQFAWDFGEVGSFMAAWVIGYGVLQSATPTIIKWITKSEAVSGRTTLWVSIFLIWIMSLLVSASFFEFYLPYLLPIGLLLFGLLFAMISSIHSYLVLSYSDGDKAASSVGFYYMANASGRLVGTLLSGILYHFGSLTACLSGSLVFVMINGLISIYLPKKELAPKRKKQK